MKKFFLGIRDSLSKKELPYFLSFTAFLVLLVVLDILSKYFAYVHLSSEGNVLGAIPGLFNFVLAFNNGAAWGMLSDQKWLLTLLSFAIGSGVLIFYLFRFSKLPKTVSLALALIVAGSYGNLIDRIGYWAGLGIYSRGVVDFLQFAFWTDFPVFNLADSYLTIGIAILLVYYLIQLIRSQMADKKKVLEIVDIDKIKDADEKKEKENTDGEQGNPQ